MKIRNIVIGITLLTFLASCSAKRDTLSYFQGIQPEAVSIAVNPTEFEPKIEPMDELVITVSSLQPELSLPYNLPMTNPANGQKGFLSQSSPQQATYFVSAEGDITMPVLGKIHVAGLTPDRLAEVIREKVAKDIEDPVVVVQLLNFKINVGGEVNRPGQFTVRDRRFSILDAISTAGDLTVYGRRDNVLLVREDNGKRVAHVLDLTNPEILQSPYFYLKQNDYIYVSPNEVRNDNAKYNQNNAYKLTVISTVVSAASVIASLVIALTIK